MWRHKQASNAGEMPFGPLTVYIYGIWENTPKIALTLIIIGWLEQSNIGEVLRCVINGVF